MHAFFSLNSMRDIICADGKKKRKKVYNGCVFSHGILGEIWCPQQNEKEKRKFIMDAFLLTEFHEKYCV